VGLRLSGRLSARRVGAVVDSVAERDVPAQIAVGEIAVGIFELPLVPVGRAVDNGHPRIGGDVNSVEGDVPERAASEGLSRAAAMARQTIGRKKS
jgi:hypothetical protein